MVVRLRSRRRVMPLAYGWGFVRVGVAGGIENARIACSPGDRDCDWVCIDILSACWGFCVNCSPTCYGSLENE